MSAKSPIPCGSGPVNGQVNIRQGIFHMCKGELF